MSEPALLFLTFLQEGGTVDEDVNEARRVIEDLYDGFVDILPRIVIGAIVFALFAVTGAAISWSMRRAFRYRSRSLAIVSGRLANWALLFLGLLVGITIIAPSVKPADLIALLGVSSVAIGFAFRDILSNLLAGILILIRQPFRIGDQVRFGDFSGTVEEIETRATVVRGFDGERVLIPNGALFTNSVVVTTAYGALRSELDVGIGYEEDIELATEVILSALADVDGVLREPAPFVVPSELAASWVTLRVYWWSSPTRANVLAVQGRTLVAIKRALQGRGIDLPFETRTLHIAQQQSSPEAQQAASSGNSGPSVVRSASRQR